MNKKYLIVTLLLCLLQYPGYAHDSQRCGTDVLRLHYSAMLPDAANKADSIRHVMVSEANDMAYNNLGQNKTTITIPVVFHIVLNAAQINRLGGQEGIAERVDSQIAVINRDFNAGYIDSLPGTFNALRGNANIGFALARRSPSGVATRGFEIIYTDKGGFREGSNVWSGRAYAEAKNLNGTITAWDPEKYLNVWVINPINASGSTSSTLGVCIPPSFLQMGIPGMSKYELGIVLNYGAFGKKSGAGFFIKDVNGGRTLTHELGHYFELMHIWGDDNGACTAPLGKDDGIADTPPQAGPSSGCPTFPFYDNCSTSGDGIMFMNFMDYTADNCMRLFTRQQVTFMRVNLSQGTYTYGLTQHPEVLQDPSMIAETSTEQIYIYPNPTTRLLHIGGIGEGKYSLRLYDALGKVVFQEDGAKAETYITADVSRLRPAIYMLVLRHKGGYFRASFLVQ